MANHPERITDSRVAGAIARYTSPTGQRLPDPAANPRLRAAVAAAREANMPKDTVDRAIKKASGGAGGVRRLWPGRRRGDGGGADRNNRNRTASDIRSAFAKHGGALGETNSVSFLFSRPGVVGYPASAGSADDMLEAAVEAGAYNVESDEEGHEVTCAADDFFAVRDALEARFGPPESARVEWRPSTSVTLDEERAATVLKLLEALEDSDDVQNVYANFDIPDAVVGVRRAAFISRRAKAGIVCLERQSNNQEARAHSSRYDRSRQQQLTCIAL